MSKSRENFVRLAERRTTRALKDIRLIGNLSNRSNYAWNGEDISKMFSALEAELKTVKQRFSDARGAKGEIEFSLDD